MAIASQKLLLRILSPYKSVHIECDTGIFYGIMFFFVMNTIAKPQVKCKTQPLLQNLSTNSCQCRMADRYLHALAEFAVVRNQTFAQPSLSPNYRCAISKYIRFLSIYLFFEQDEHINSDSEKFASHLIL